MLAPTIAASCAMVCVCSRQSPNSGYETAVSLATRVHDAERNDLVGVVEWQAAKENGVDEGEDGCVGADAERQGRGRGEGKPPILDQQTGCEPDILPQSIMRTSEFKDVRIQDLRTSNPSNP